MPDIRARGESLSLQGRGPSIGIVPGARNALAAYARNGAVEVLASRQREGQDPASLFTALREDAEVRLGTFVSSCVLAVPARFSPGQRAALVRAANASGLEDVKTVEEPVAAALAFGHGGRFLVLDLGADTADLSVVEGGGGAWQELESETAEDIGGRRIDAALADWLRERLLLPRMKEGDPRWRTLLREAERVKVALSDAPSFRWTPPGLEGGVPLAELTVEREDLERLIRFPIRRLVHTARRLWDRHRPERLLLTGGSVRIPILREILKQEMERVEVLTLENAAVRGAALYASENRGESVDAGRKFQEVRLSLVGLETHLTRLQQDRLHLLFSRAEGASTDPEMLALLEGLARDLRDAVA